MARVRIAGRYNLAKIASDAGQLDENKRSYVDGELIVEDISQEALDAAVAAYDPIQSLKDGRKWEMAKAMNAQLRDEIPVFGVMRILMKKMDRQPLTSGESSVIQKMSDANDRLRQLEVQVDNAQTEEDILAIRW